MAEEIEENEFILRPIKCELNQLSMSDGSAMLMQGKLTSIINIVTVTNRWTLGDTAVLAGIYGPIESKPQKMIYDKACIEVSYIPIKGPASKSQIVSHQTLISTNLLQIQ